MRPVMTQAELTTHHTGRHGRDYSLSDDGYEDMEVAEGRGWRVLAGWGSDGWDLGDWPYVCIYIRNRDGTFQLLQIVEGDHDTYVFATGEDRAAAIDYLFHWYRSPINIPRRALEQGIAEIPERYRGPYRSDRATV